MTAESDPSRLLIEPIELSPPSGQTPRQAFESVASRPDNPDQRNDEGNNLNQKTTISSSIALITFCSLCFYFACNLNFGLISIVYLIFAIISPVMAKCSTYSILVFSIFAIVFSLLALILKLVTSIVFHFYGIPEQFQHLVHSFGLSEQIKHTVYLPDCISIITSLIYFSCRRRGDDEEHNQEKPLNTTNCCKCYEYLIVFTAGCISCWDNSYFSFGFLLWGIYLITIRALGGKLYLGVFRVSIGISWTVVMIYILAAYLLQIQIIRNHFGEFPSIGIYYIETMSGGILKVRLATGSISHLL